MTITLGTWLLPFDGLAVGSGVVPAAYALSSVAVNGVGPICERRGDFLDFDFEIIDTSPDTTYNAHILARGNRRRAVRAGNGESAKRR